MLILTFDSLKINFSNNVSQKKLQMKSFSAISPIVVVYLALIPKRIVANLRSIDRVPAFVNATTSRRLKLCPKTLVPGHENVKL